MGPSPCRVCNNSASKYKCPSCLIPYCSLGCFRKHKENTCEKKPRLLDGDTLLPAAKKPAPIATGASGSDEDGRAVFIDRSTEVLGQEKFESIASSAEIREALKSEDIRKLICTVDSSPNPEKELDKVMELDMFRVFADKVLFAFR